MRDKFGLNKPQYGLIKSPETIANLIKLAMFIISLICLLLVNFLF